MLTLTQSLFTRNIWTFQKSDELDKAYKEILNEYLGVDIYHKGDWTYEEISTAIKNYSLITSLIPLNRVLLQKVKIS